MTDLERMQSLMAFILEIIEPHKRKLQDLVVANQNPNCGGDRFMTKDQWIQARDFVNSLNSLKYIEAPPGKTNKLSEMDANIGGLTDAEIAELMGCCLGIK